MRYESNRSTRLDQTRMFGRRFQPTLWGTLAAAAGVTAGILLGQWQLGRAQEKLEYAAKLSQSAAQPPVHIGPGTIDPAALELQAVEASGRFEPRGMVLIDNRVRNGVVGYEVVMPLRLSERGRGHEQERKRGEAADHENPPEGYGRRNRCDRAVPYRDKTRQARWR